MLVLRGIDCVKVLSWLARSSRSGGFAGWLVGWSDYLAGLGFGVWDSVEGCFGLEACGWGGGGRGV